MLNVPIAIERVTLENMDEHVRTLLRVGADRVFLCLFKNFVDPIDALNEQLNRFVLFKEKLHENGMEAGIWLDVFGHGFAEIGYKELNKKYCPQEGVVGKSKDTFCPLDKNFETDYKKYLKHIAETRPDVIMFDDDYRFSVRSYGVGCFCKNHRQALYEKTGKRMSKLSLFKKIFSGGANPLRDAWLEVSGKSLENFALSMRETVDGVDKNIRLGCCMCLDTLDLAGTDALSLAKAFAGGTKPFFRTIGAPYWQATTPWGDSRAAAEYTRMETAWFDKEKDDVEIFAEGDVYPRPRYVVPSNYLECYDAYLRADGRAGILKYIFDYYYPLGYEEGYIERHVYRRETSDKIAEAFRGGIQRGVELFEPMKKIRTWNLEKNILPEKDFLPPKPEKSAARFFDGLIRKPYYHFNGYFEKTKLLETCSFGRAQRLFAGNGIPTLYVESDGAVVCFGESARFLPTSYLKRGVILDARAAAILTERGIDVGFVKAEPEYPEKEEFPFGTDHGIKKCRYLRSLQHAENADVFSVYRPSGKTSSYFYRQGENSFFVLGLDAVLAPLKGDEWYFNNYYRVRAMKEGAERVSAAPLPAYCPNINLSLLYAEKTDGSRVLGLFNFFIDGIVNPKITLSDPVSSVSCVGCEAEIVDGGVRIKGEIPPYGFAALILS